MTRRRFALARSDLTIDPLEATGTLAGVHVERGREASSIVLARHRRALVEVDFAVSTGRARLTQTVVVVHSVDADASVETRIGIAFVDLNLASEDQNQLLDFEYLGFLDDCRLLTDFP